VTNEASNLPNVPTFNDMVDAWAKAATDAERRWNEYFNQQMSSDEFARSMSRQMESYATLQANFARGMEQYLRAMSIPTQSDLAKLAERLTALELRLDALESAEEENGAATATYGGKRSKRKQSKQAG
jgi:hypothetical protein